MKQEFSTSLKNICSISVGMTLRGKPVAVVDGRFRLIQLGDIDGQGRIFIDTTLQANGDDSFERFRVHKGDIVFKGRGATLSAALVKEESNLVAVAPLIIVRPNNRIIQPEYLAWVMNAPSSQEYFAKFLQGSSISGVNKVDLEALPVPLPPPGIQNAIAETHVLHSREKEIVSKIQELKSRMTQKVLETCALQYTPSLRKTPA